MDYYVVTLTNGVTLTVYPDSALYARVAGIARVVHVRGYRNGR